MSKLTKEEIQYIENYLIKNEVKYWDVRLELLDHIVSAVEDKIETEGISFNEALLDVHKGFGNQSITFGISKTEVFDKGLYQSNNGFKKFKRQKQKELGRKYRLQTWLALKKQLKSFNFLVEYAAVILLLFTVFKYYPLMAAVSGLVILFIPYSYSCVYYFKNKATRKSLSIAMVGNFGFFLFSMYNLGFQLCNMYFEKGEPKPYILFLLATCITYPILRAQLEVYIKVYTETLKVYNLKRS